MESNLLERISPNLELKESHEKFREVINISIRNVNEVIEHLTDAYSSKRQPIEILSESGDKDMKNNYRY